MEAAEKKGEQKLITTRKETANFDTTELEQEIDRLVYDLYGLSEEEIGIVEGGN